MRRFFFRADTVDAEPECSEEEWVKFNGKIRLDLSKHKETALTELNILKLRVTNSVEWTKTDEGNKRELHKLLHNFCNAHQI